MAYVPVWFVGGAVFICTKDLAGAAHSRMGQGYIEVGRFTGIIGIYIPPPAMARRSTGTLNMCSSFGLSFYILGNLRACMHRHVCITYLHIVRRYCAKQKGILFYCP